MNKEIIPGRFYNVYVDCTELKKFFDEAIGIDSEIIVEVKFGRQGGFKDELMHYAYKVIKYNRSFHLIEKIYGNWGEGELGRIYESIRKQLARMTKE